MNRKCLIKRRTFVHDALGAAIKRRLSRHRWGSRQKFTAFSVNHNFFTSSRTSSAAASALASTDERGRAKPKIAESTIVNCDNKKHGGTAQLRRIRRGWSWINVRPRALYEYRTHRDEYRDNCDSFDSIGRTI